MNITMYHSLDPLSLDEEVIFDVRPRKPLNTRTRKTVLKERRRLANAPKSIQKRMLKRK